MFTTLALSPLVQSSVRLKSISGHNSYRSPSRVNFRCSAVVQSAPSTCLYEVLRIPMGASIKEIKAAYRQLARIHHPDVAVDSLASDFVKINSAYSTLSDPVCQALIMTVGYHEGHVHMVVVSLWLLDQRQQGSRVTRAENGIPKNVGSLSNSDTPIFCC